MYRFYSLQRFIALPLLLLLVALGTFLSSEQLSSKQAIASSPCPNGYKVDKGLNPGQLIDNHGHLGQIDQISQKLAASCAGVVKLDVITTPGCVARNKKRTR